MSRPLRIAIVNDVYASSVSSPDALLDRFTTLTGWSDAVAARDAEVRVFQRFSSPATIVRGSVTYSFHADTAAPRPAGRFAGNAGILGDLAVWRPDVIHVNGLDYPRSIRMLRRRIPSTAARPRTPAIVVQDHGGFDPLRLHTTRRMWMRYGLGAANALFVATPPQIDRFRSSGLVPGRVRICDVMEGSTTLRVVGPRERPGNPALLWVGRLNDNKDPLTVLAGFATFVALQPAARLTFVYQASDLEPRLQAAVERDERLRRSVTLRGAVPHNRLADEYAAADFFVLGSHQEGSGYAVLEALACGVPPVVTDIPSFRWITDGGRIGSLWTPGDAGSLRAALERAMARPVEAQRDACRRRFEEHFSWEAVGTRAVRIYGELLRT